MSNIIHETIWSEDGQAREVEVIDLTNSPSISPGIPIAHPVPRRPCRLLCLDTASPEITSGSSSSKTEEPKGSTMDFRPYGNVLSLATRGDGLSACERFWIAYSRRWRLGSSSYVLVRGLVKCWGLLGAKVPRKLFKRHRAAELMRPVARYYGGDGGQQQQQREALVDKRQKKTSGMSAPSSSSSSLPTSSFSFSSLPTSASASSSTAQPCSPSSFTTTSSSSSVTTEYCRSIRGFGVKLPPLRRLSHRHESINDERRRRNGGHHGRQRQQQRYLEPPGWTSFELEEASAALGGCFEAACVFDFASFGFAE
ncbi:hypothetical protein G7054_g7496 [Neopestalotiopsis clavispora]|nr:hypothetical protein G7054_g7496 [Neopestalotiopsis clavispora]